MCHFSFSRQIISYNKGIVQVNLLSIEQNCLHYVSNPQNPIVIRANCQEALVRSDKDSVLLPSNFLDSLIE